MKTIAVILGTRPEAIKLIPLYKSLKENDFFDTKLISTGQHQEMLTQIFDFFEIVPDYDFGLMTTNQSLAEITCRIIEKLNLFFTENFFDAIIVQGDTTTSMASALTAFYHKKVVIHVEAGLRTYDKLSPFPEEINRQITGVIADIHFAPTKSAVKKLKKENKKSHIYMVGNTVIDSLLFAKRKISMQMEEYENFYKTMLNPFSEMILITGHRRESFGKGFENICESIRRLANQNPDFSFIYPVHLNPHVKEVVFKKLNSIKNVFLLNPVSYDHMVFLMQKAYLIMTDSGGIQEEAPSLNKPIVVLRNNTERPEGIEAGCAILAGTDPQKITKIVTELITDQSLYEKMSLATSPYGNGKTSQEIVEVLKIYFGKFA